MPENAQQAAELRRLEAKKHHSIVKQERLKKVPIEDQTLLT